MANKEKHNGKVHFSDEMEKIEVPQANPDIISDEEALNLWGSATPLTEEEEKLLSLYYRSVALGALKFLTKRERKYWKLAFFNWLSYADIAKKENVTRNTVYLTINRAAMKIKENIGGKYKAMQHRNRVLERPMTKKQISDWETRQGFAKNVHEVGMTNTDPLINERLELHKDEIEEFFKQHPEVPKKEN